MAQFYSVLTNYGVTAFARAISSNQPLNILKMAVGDGNGQTVAPNANHTTLVREKYRANISSIKLDPRNNKQVIFELTIPENVGGFYIREIGIFDENEKLVAIANTPESYKPQLTEGSGKIQVLRMILLVSSSDSVSLTVDNSLIWAKRSELTPKDLDENSESIIEENGHSHKLPLATLVKKGIVKLFSGLDSTAEDMAATPKAIKTLKDLIDALTRNLGNYIPNSKKSNAVDSNSADTVATSIAVKTAYDLANSKQSPATTLAGYGITDSIQVDNQGKNAEQLNDLMLKGNSVASYHLKTGGQLPADAYGYGLILSLKSSSAYGQFVMTHTNQIYFRAHHGNNQIRDWIRIDGADKVNKSGDTMAGQLNINTDVPLIKLKRNNEDIGFIGTANGITNNIKVHSYKHDTFLELQDSKAYINKLLELAGNIVVKNGDWSKIELWNRANKQLIIESKQDNTSSIGNIIYRNGSNNEAAINIPRKSGTIALIEDVVSYQKIGNFEIRKYSDGTMIQTCLHRNGGLDYNRNPNDTSDVITLVYPLAFIDMPAVNVTPQLSHPYFDDANGGLTTNDKSKRLGSPIGEANDGSVGLTIDNNRSQCQFNYVNGKVFLSEMTFHITAIGRWK